MGGVKRIRKLRQVSRHYMMVILARVIVKDVDVYLSDTNRISQRIGCEMWEKEESVMTPGRVVRKTGN